MVGEMGRAMVSRASECPRLPPRPAAAQGLLLWFARTLHCALHHRRAVLAVAPIALVACAHPTPSCARWACVECVHACIEHSAS